MNYALEMEKIIDKLSTVPTLLLHSCCAPCSSHVISLLADYFDIIVFYYNPNIAPIEEYNKRKEEQIKLIQMLKTKNKLHWIDCDYDNLKYEETIKGLEMEKERGKRCHKCYHLRMEKTAKVALEKKYDYFATTLTVSPHKDANIINSIGLFLEKEYNIKYLPSDFKKKDGYKHSIELSKKYHLYRQNYCGCIYSRRDLCNKN